MTSFPLGFPDLFLFSRLLDNVTAGRIVRSLGRATRSRLRHDLTSQGRLCYDYQFDDVAGMMEVVTNAG